MAKPSVLIIEDTINFKKGQLLENYKRVDEGIEDMEGNYLNENKVVFLTEKLSSEDEKKVRELIRTQLKALLWNLYTKNSILIGQ